MNEKQFLFLPEQKLIIAKKNIATVFVTPETEKRIYIELNCETKFKYHFPYSEVAWKSITEQLEAYTMEEEKARYKEFIKTISETSKGD